MPIVLLLITVSTSLMHLWSLPPHTLWDSLSSWPTKWCYHLNSSFVRQPLTIPDLYALRWPKCLWNPVEPATTCNEPHMITRKTAADRALLTSMWERDSDSCPWQAHGWKWMEWICSERWCVSLTILINPNTPSQIIHDNIHRYWWIQLKYTYIYTYIYIYTMK